MKRVTIPDMIATTSPLAYSAASPAVAVRRRITPEAGHALEILGHAIEYLSDELAIDRTPLASNRGRVEAIELLMALNRRIYYECPEIPTLAQRLTSWLRHQA
jgi:hypothetical protein